MDAHFDPSLFPHFRTDFRIISSFISPQSRVLDVGCGTGELLEFLNDRLKIEAHGIDISEKNIAICHEKNLSAVQADAHHNLNQYGTNSFDYVILSRTLQQMSSPHAILQELLRIGKSVIISIPNFGYWRVRLSLLCKGRMPITKELPYSWYNTPNIHFATLLDFKEMLHEMHIAIDHIVALHRSGKMIPSYVPQHLWNLLSQQAVFVLHQNKSL